MADDWTGPRAPAVFLSGFLARGRTLSAGVDAAGLRPLLGETSGFERRLRSPGFRDQCVLRDFLFAQTYVYRDASSIPETGGRMAGALFLRPSRGSR